ncbi:ABC transporter permease [Sinosporangium siamense]|uniref:Transport permease protein n=1 Tax=Sinosporangium siamense TaxID=1367973 RepID=A0A919RHF3_9ACTN|nr:ABC transporter permease [Sinosporangium siamense]GII93653.1 transport permease protein [Sinosporangium siamense]
MNALSSLSRAMLLGFLRDKASVFFTILFPLMFLLLFGVLLQDPGVSKSDVVQIGAVPIVDQMPADARARIGEVAALTKSTDREDALAKVRTGDIDAVVEQTGDTVVLHYSAADQVRAGSVRGVFDSLIMSANTADRPPKYSLDSRQVEDASLKPIQYLTPGLLGWAVAMGATFGAAMTLVTWRQKKILRRLRLSPAPTGAVVAARVGVSVGLALVQTAIFIGVAMTPYFGLTLSPFWWMSIPLVIAGTLAFLSVGLLAGGVAKTAEGASGIANLVVLPMAFLSGAFFPMEGAPSWLQAVSQVMPLRYLNEGMIDVMVRGQGPSAVLMEMGVLLGFTAVVSIIVVKVFRWDDV